jgi:toxin ParE1/3/4
VKTRVLAPALQEITEAAIWFDAQRAGLGDEFWHSVEAMWSRIEANPLAFAKSEFATADTDLRFAIIRRFNYVVHFLIEPNEAQIVAVAHGARKPGYWLRRTKHGPQR